MNLRQLRGVRALVTDAVEHGTTAVQTVHLKTADRTFAVLEAIPPTAAAARVVHGVHDAYLGFVYGSIRGVNRLVGSALEAALDVADPTPTTPAAEQEP